MLPLLLTISLILAALVLYSYCTGFWFRHWRRSKSYSAHALFLINGTMLIAIILGLFRFVDNLVTEPEGRMCPFEISIWLTLFVNSFFNIALAKGYFVKIKE